VIAVVIPARDAAAVLPRLLASLAEQTLARREFEVVVVDNASRDATAAVARSHGARVVHEPRPSRAGARNAGVAATDAPRIAFVDAECEAEPGWLEALDACLDEAPLAAGPVGLRMPQAPGALERFDALWRFDQRLHVERDGWAASANLGIRREAFEEIGGFDAAYRQIGEDVDLCLRAGKAGHELAYCPRARVWHPAEGDLLAMLRRAYRHGWSSAQHRRRVDGQVGERVHRHPGPLVRGDWALRRLDVEPDRLEPAERRAMLRLARLEYAARMSGSLAAALRPRASG
jgi:GT2 family glycosyltransferase